MFICAVRALEQFHKHGIHNDINAKNFVIPYNHNLNTPLESCKLIDFNKSVLNSDQRTIEFYRACTQNKANNRPNAQSIHNFLKGEYNLF
uniref:Protein kinase domain-containing protein n=1 Tax=Meloidogyne hapla TaxID=6305 RepID=A0A1I8B209_MELHA